MTDELRAERCETCAWWTREPPLATGVRQPEGADPNLGACHIDPPSGGHMGGMYVSVFPAVHAHRFCSMWTPDGDDDGEREDVPDATVVPLRRAAA